LPAPRIRKGSGGGEAREGPHVVKSSWLPGGVGGVGQNCRRTGENTHEGGERGKGICYSSQGETRGGGGSKDAKGFSGCFDEVKRKRRGGREKEKKVYDGGWGETRGKPGRGRGGTSKVIVR